jgi:hypothetical protein
MDRAPKRPVRVVLIKEVIFSLPEEGPVGVIHPVCRSNKMIERPVRLSRDCDPQI